MPGAAQSGGALHRCGGEHPRRIHGTADPALYMYTATVETSDLPVLLTAAAVDIPARIRNIADPAVLLPVAAVETSDPAVLLTTAAVDVHA